MKQTLCVIFLASVVGLLVSAAAACAAEHQVSETADQIKTVTPQIEAAVRKRGYVSGVAAQSFLDKKSGFRDPGFGLDIADWIMEPGNDAGYFDSIDEMYRVYDQYKGHTALEVSQDGWKLRK